VDFYCPKEKLIIELDGANHFNEKQKKYDVKRNSYFESLELRAIRFECQEVLYYTENILKKITVMFKY